MPAPRRPATPTVTFWGAARAVTGSMHRVDAGGLSVLLDCGLYQGKRAEARRRNERFTFKPKEIDAVILSHAHVDHCGNLPNLVKQGFKGPIYCTPATRALASVMLGDAAKIQTEDASYLNRKRERGEPAVEPLYDARDVYRTLLRFEAVPYGKRANHGRMEFSFHDAGHLLGSAMVSLAAEGRRLTFTGDLGRAHQPILRPPVGVPPADLIVSEATYGGLRHEPVDETAERLGEVLRRTAARGGKLIIPAFAVGRTQTVVYFLHQLMNRGATPDVPIFVDSPMAVRATEVFRAHPECFSDETLALLERDANLFGDNRVRYVESVHESVALNHLQGPAVIISASGMCEAGRVLHHLKHHVEFANNTVLIAGYQAQDTLGRRLVEKRPEVKILGRTVKVRAEVVVLHGLSSHADHADLLAALEPHAKTCREVCLVHAEEPRALALETDLRLAGFASVRVPEPGDSAAI